MTHVLQNHTQSPLIGIIVEEKGKEVVRYFTDEKAADAAVSQNATQAALSVIGAQSLARGAILILMRRLTHLTASDMRASRHHP